MTITCCYDCKDRYLSCHGSCEKYAREKECVQTAKENRMKQKEKQWLVDHMLKKRRHENK